MIKSYFKITWRTIRRNKAFSFINILGLALGMTCSLLILLWVTDERKVDAFHENGPQLYSVFERQYHDGQIDAGFYTPGPLAEEMKLTLPEVQYATGMAWSEASTFEVGEKILKENGDYAGADFFIMFTYPLLAGQATTALKSPVDIAISRKMAADFFGSPEQALGKSIRYQSRKDLKVTAVFENIPESSSRKFDYVINWETFLQNNGWAREWGNNGPQTYLMLRQGTDVPAFEAKIKSFLDLYNKDQNDNFRIKLGLQKYSDVYLHSNFKNGELTGGRIQYVILFSIIAVFILLIACINFMNLTTARSIKRAKEIGIRKVVGAFRSALIRQFIGEALLIVSGAVILALLVVPLTLPVFNEITRKQITLPIQEPTFWFSILGLTILTGTLSGSYPALYLSSFNPVSVLKGSLKFGSSAIGFRKGLVVFQFVLSIMLIIGTIVITEQVNYVQSANLGYDRENLIYIPLEGDLAKKYTLFKDQALTMPGIQGITSMTQTPTSINNGTGGVEWEGKDPTSAQQFVQAAVGFDFTKTMHIEMVQGRDFSKDFESDSTGYILNEAALKIINYKDPVGMPLTFWQKKGTIIGVMKDFHFNSLHTAINPLILRRGEMIGYGAALVRTEPGKTKEALASLEKICKELNPQFPFTYEFSDEEYQKLYKSEQVVSKLSNSFAFLAVFISCLGLLGLAMFTAEQRLKEIGIRKVLGASIVSLFSLLSKEIMILITIALVIASPLAYFTMNNWLKDYVYRIDIAWWIFAVTGGLAILIALLTVSFQTIKALLANPVKSLRSE
ncbi:MAG TPA: ABC transporter permease [Chryseolinea sp.]